MDKKIIKIGSSYGIVIDKSILESLNIKKDTKFDLIIQDRDTITLKIKRQ